MIEVTQHDLDFCKAATNAQELEILTPPHPTLRKIARPIKPEDIRDIKEVIPRMFATMYNAPGIGLAAPQIGLSQRFIVIDISRDEDDRHPLVLINPEIIEETEDMSVREEGCLSLPQQYAEVGRPEKVRVQWQNIDGTLQQAETEGLLATCLQHEIDHLEGTLFIDHLSKLRRSMILRRLAKEQKRKRKS